MPWEGGRVKLTVADTGCGIAEEDIPKICEPYARADTDQVRNTAGTGLGLPIVKRLVELQNGSFAITSAIGKGTTVEVVLPAAPAVQPVSIGSDSSFAH
jgi:signal transduction histidine kinase